MEQFLVDEVIAFFTSRITNPQKAEEIKSICLSKNPNEYEGNRSRDLDYGLYCIRDFLDYFSAKYPNRGFSSISNLRKILKLLVDNSVLEPMISMNKVVPFSSELYSCLGRESMIASLSKRDLINNVVLGWPFIAQKYSDSVVAIEIFHPNGDISIGTGFYAQEYGAHCIVTNKHVVADAKRISINSKRNQEISFVSIVQDPNRDLAIIQLTEDPKVRPLWISPYAEILSEIITLGYPRIPTTKQPYQICHKGEINSFVESFQNENLFLISARSSAGSSGSPVIDRFGMVVGIVTKELFVEEDFLDRGINPYYAAIQGSEILNFYQKEHDVRP
jgi:hypothetical protein